MIRKCLVIALTLVALLFSVAAQAQLTVIGTAQLPGDATRYNLIWDDDNNGNSVIWLDYTHAVASRAALQEWAAGLAAELIYDINDNYLVDWGTTSWRLPSTGSTFSTAYNDTSSEFGHLYYAELGLPSYNENGGGLSDEQLNQIPFSHLIASFYREESLDREEGWIYISRNGHQYRYDATRNAYGIALRNGSVTTSTGTIFGTLFTDASKTTTITADVTVYAYLNDPCNGEYLGSVVAGSDSWPTGYFSLAHLPEGEIYISTTANSWHDYLATYYDTIDGARRCQGAASLDLPVNGSINGIDMVLPLAGEINGSVLSFSAEEIGHTALYPYFGLYPHGYWIPEGQYTIADGSFELSGLPAGDISLLATPPVGFVPVWWTADGLGVTDGNAATLISIAPGDSEGPINFTLQFSGDINKDSDVDGLDLALLVGQSKPPVASVVAMFALDFATVTPVVCGSGEHNGGDGTCQPLGSCSSGYELIGAECSKKVNGMTFQGLDGDNEGFVTWNSNGDGVEPENFGHDIPATYAPCFAGPLPVSYGNATYYISSPDYPGPPLSDGTAINEQSLGAGHISQAIQGFSQTKAALQAGGFAESDLRLSYGLLSLGADVEGQDWFFAGSVETRYYNGAELVFTLAGTPLIKGAMPELTVTINYATPQDCFDDTINAKTAPLAANTFVDVSGTASTAVQVVAQALLADLALLSPLSLDMADITPDPDELAADGRFGRAFYINSLHLR